MTLLVDNSLRPSVRNGNHLEEEFTVDNRDWLVVNTCVFDSIFELLVDAYEYNPVFKNYFQNYSSTNQTVKLIEDYISSGYDLELFYQTRAEILYTSGTSDINIENRGITCTTGSGEMFDAILKNVPVIQRFKNCDNVDCLFQAETSKKSNTLLLHKTREIFDVKDFEEYIEYSLQWLDRTGKSCPNCSKRTLSHSSVLGNAPVLAIHVESFAYDRDITPETLPKTFSFRNRVYELHGFIEYEGLKSRIGHFKSNYYSKGRWEMRDDLKRGKTFLVNKFQKNMIVSLVVYIEKIVDA